MQQAINDIFRNLFISLKEVMANFVTDPGTSWGLSIILFTLLFNLILFPLNNRSMQSSRKMSMIQPEIQKIQARYKDDPAKLQAAQQKLMKDNKVSMWGGCLPMLIQWPLFIALFGLFRELALEGSLNYSFGGFLVPNLGATNNIPLTILVVITMILSTRLTQKANEKNMDEKAKQQAKSMNTMNYVMAAMIGWFTWSSPAALGLYWVTGNVFRVIQQLILNAVRKEEDYVIIPANLPEEPTKRKRNKVIRK